jgi:proteasome lid subunit RPN8/RPN11
MGVRIATDLLAHILTEAAASPDEICGLLFGTPDVIAAAQPCRNVATDPRARFEIDPAALIAAHRAARAGGPALVGCYHSHPRGNAMPSPRDAADAQANGWLWLIVGDGEVRAFRAVKVGSVDERFEPIRIVPSHPGLEPGSRFLHRSRVAGPGSRPG